MNPCALPRRCPALIALLLDAAVASAEPFTFGVVGDYGTNNSAERDVANLIRSWNPDFILTLGDNNYSSDPTSWDARIGQYYHEYIYNYQGAYGPGSPSRRFFPNIGNHDYDAGIQGYLDYLDLPGNERYYTYRRGPVEFFVLNSNPEEPDGISRTSKQATWLQGTMAASTATWKIVSLHHPPYASGSASGTMRWPFEEWGADVVMAGHLHNYERLRVDGIDYFVNGLGGAGISGFGTTAAGSQIRYRDSHGAMRIVADDSFMRFQFISKSGQIIDDYTIGVVTSPAARHWNTAVENGSWEVPANWSPAGIPVAGQDVFISQEDEMDRTVSYASASGAAAPLRSLNIDARSTGMMTLRQARDTLSVLSLHIAPSMGSRGTFEKTGGTLLAARIVNRGTFTHGGGTMQVTESFENAGGVATIGGEHRWGAGATLAVAAGQVRLDTTARSDDASGLSIDVRPGAAVYFGASQRLRALSIAGNADLAAGGGVVLHTAALSITEDATLDLADNALVLRGATAAQADDLARVVALVASGRNDGGTPWTGGGITSSAARSDPGSTLAVLSNPGLTEFRGQAIGIADILIAFTRNGDANLDGKVDADDYFRIDAGFAEGMRGMRGYSNGDFNYDGEIDADDYFLIDSAFASPEMAIIAAGAGAAVVNPEPAMLPLVLALWALRSRRRRGNGG